MKKPLITGDSPGAKEVLVDGENCVLCKMASPQDLADAISYLKNNSDVRDKIATNGYKIALEKLTPKQVTSPLVSLLEKK